MVYDAVAQHLFTGLWIRQDPHCTVNNTMDNSQSSIRRKELPNIHCVKSQTAMHSSRCTEGTKLYWCCSIVVLLVLSDRPHKFHRPDLFRNWSLQFFTQGSLGSAKTPWYFCNQQVSSWSKFLAWNQKREWLVVQRFYGAISNSINSKKEEFCVTQSFTYRQSITFNRLLFDFHFQLLVQKLGCLKNFHLQSHICPLLLHSRIFACTVPKAGVFNIRFWWLFEFWARNAYWEMQKVMVPDLTE